MTVASLAVNYATLVNRLAVEVGAFPTNPAVDVITEGGKVSTQQAADILQAIRDGLLAVYNAYEWSFLRPLVTISTLPSYSTGTITIDASGNVTGIGTTFPSYAASSNGWLYFGLGGAFPITTYSGATSLVLGNYTFGAQATPTTYSIWFNRYALPTGIDSLKGPLLYPPNAQNGMREGVAAWDQTHLRKQLQMMCQPGRPLAYCEETTNPISNPTAESSRYVLLWPPPNCQTVLEGIGTVRPTMIDSTNQYPLGIEVLSLVLQESCLAAWERNVERKGPGNPEATHNAMFGPLLQQAVEMDKRKGAPEIIGTMHGGRGGGRDITPARLPVYLDMANFPVGWIG
jgi:hypothetical protein